MNCLPQTFWSVFQDVRDSRESSGREGRTSSRDKGTKKIKKPVPGYLTAQISRDKFSSDLMLEQMDHSNSEQISSPAWGKTFSNPKFYDLLHWVHTFFFTPYHYFNHHDIRLAWEVSFMVLMAYNCCGISGCVSPSPGDGACSDIWTF